MNKETVLLDFYISLNVGAAVSIYSGSIIEGLQVFGGWFVFMLFGTWVASLFQPAK
jgi:hypothetical protein